MNENKRPEGFIIFTIGHSNHELKKYIDFLKARKIDVLVDVRSNPFSRFAPQFNKKRIEKAVKADGMKYLFLGKELGGRPQGSEFYDADGFVLYDRLAESPFFLEGIERLVKGVRKHRVALMCSEENPANCHRRFLVAWILADRGVNVLHVRGDGTIQAEDELAMKNNRKKDNHVQIGELGGHHMRTLNRKYIRHKNSFLS